MLDAAMPGRAMDHAMRPQHILSQGGGFVALVVVFTACRISPTDARPEEWNGRPAEPFLLVAEAAESSIDITLAAIEVATERRRHSWTIARSTSTSVRIS